MAEAPGPARADADLVRAWLGARSAARGLPQPVAEAGGWRVETGSPTEVRRHVFARPAGLAKLARDITSPRIFLKLCGEDAELRALTPPRWRIQPASYMMTCGGAIHTGPALSPVLSNDYRLHLSAKDGVAAASIFADHGALAASGYAAEGDGVFIYDRIVTEPAYRRRGLGAAIMKALGSTRRSNAAIQVLVATEEGRALYSTLGWAVHAPYATAVIPAES